MTGGVVSAMIVTFTVSVELAPKLSVTVSVITCVPNGRVTVGITPVVVPKGPVQVKLSASPSGSLDPLPFKVTDVPLGLLHSTV
jgi:hypothetical protein